MSGFMAKFLNRFVDRLEHRQQWVWEYVSKETPKPPPEGRLWRCPACLGKCVLESGDVCPQCHGDGRIRE